mmetsp:Transcript_15740/g.23959  ORF Transcript_15740/g.23959 Transcript_15740/m.23959 type:complete len:510 (+) Transcript_15740:151-1680(+)
MPPAKEGELPGGIRVGQGTYSSGNGANAGTTATSAVSMGNGPPESDAPYVNMENAEDQMMKTLELEQERLADDGKSIVSTVLTADGISDVRGFSIVCFVVLIGDMSRGVMFPTLWPLIESIGGSTITLGYAVASFSFGRILAAPVFGYWSDRVSGYRSILITSCSLLVVGTLVYAQAPAIGKRGFLIAAQMILGIGSGTLGVTRSYVAAVTPHRQRTTYMAWLTAVQYGGFTMTPFLGATFTAILKEDGIGYGLFQLNMYTAPAFFMCFICLVTLFLLLFLFQDPEIESKAKKKSKKEQSRDELGGTPVFGGLLTVYDACLIGCMFLNISTKGSIAAFETLGIAFASSHFDIYSARAGATVGACGTIGVVALLSMKYLGKIMSDLQMVCSGMLIMFAGVFALTRVEDGKDNPTWLYVVSIFLVYAVGYPIGHTAVIGMYSKIAGKRPQGFLMGMFASAGSLARMIFPVLSGYIAKNDAVDVFYVLLWVLGISLVVVVVFRDTVSKMAGS